MNDPTVKAAPKAKYPARGRDLPDRVTKGECLDGLPGLRESLLQLSPGVAPGFGGLKNEHLICLGKNWEEGQLGWLEMFGIHYLNGELPPWFYRVWGSVTTFPLFKTNQMDPQQVRPVGVESSLNWVLISKM